MAAACVRPTDPTAPRHAFTVDVEDWYQSCIDFDAPISDRVVRNTNRILEMLSRTNVRGTFFVQGMVAEALPRVVEALVREGHEVQSHGYSHRPLNRMSRAALRDELERAKKTVEDAAGMSVTAFRAQDFSVLKSNLWALEAIAEVGFEIDSSIFPMQSPRYGIGGWTLAPHHVILNGGARLLEVPVAIWARGPLRVPVAGGGYFRVLPEPVLERAIRSIDAAGRPAVIYCHPYEFAPQELAGYANLPWKLRVSQGLGRSRFEARMTRFLRSAPFGPLRDVLDAWSVR
ncbi:MAG: polysaccharide deacetylase family protein [Gaiellales bacterium]